MTNHYTYQIAWSPEDGEYVATCAEFPSLSWLANDALSALRGLVSIIKDYSAQMVAFNEVMQDDHDVLRKLANDKY